MTLLPLFNGNRTERTTEIRTSPNYRLTDVKRLAALNKSFFLFWRAGALKRKRKQDDIIINPLNFYDSRKEVV